MNTENNILKALKNRENIKKNLLSEEQDKIDTQAAYNKIKSRLGTERPLYFRYIAYSAGIAASIALFLFVTLNVNKWQTSSSLNSISSIGVIQDKVSLITSSGDVINLNEKKSLEMVEKDGTSLLKKYNTITYSAENEDGSNNRLFNKISVPCGRDFKVTLSDGTLVYLKENSSICFPVQFDKNHRDIYLEGDAYFDVTRDEKRPFVVNANKTSITVLGTTFNVYAGKESERVEATLISGKVKVEHKKCAPVILYPSEQALFDNETNIIEVKKVNIDDFKYENMEVISFKNASLEQIMKVIADWYYVDPLFENEDIKNLKTDCKVSRKETLDQFLDLLEAIHPINITANNDTIIIQSKKQ